MPTIPRTEISRSQSTLIDIARILLLIQVIVGHLMALLVPPLAILKFDSIEGILLIAARASFAYGREAAYIFIFLSGYFTANQLFCNRVTAKDARSILYRRLKRLMGIGSIAVCYTIAMDWLGYSVFRIPIYRHNGLHIQLPEKLDALSVALNFAQLQPSIVNPIGTNGPLWTLGYLVQFTVLGYVVRHCLKFNNKFIAAITFIAALLAVINPEFSCLLLVWLAGGWLGNRSFTSTTSISRMKIATRVIILLLLIITARTQGQYLAILICAGFGGLFISLVSQLRISISPYIARVTGALSAATFGAYIFHLPLSFLLVGSYLNSNMAIDIKGQPGGTVAQFLVSCGVIVFISMLLGQFMASTLRMKRRG